MNSTISKDLNEDPASHANLVAEETANETLDESSNASNDNSDNRSDNPSDDESFLVFEEETAFSDGFDCLRWSIFEDVLNSQVYEDLSNRRASTLRPFYGHPITELSATEPPCYMIAFTTEALPEIETPGYKRPSRLMVSRDDGGIVTIADVFYKLSSYIQANKEDILWVLRATVQFDPPLRPYQDIPGGTQLSFCGLNPTILHGELDSVGVLIDDGN
jgi:hypothetical protein